LDVELKTGDRVRLAIAPPYFKTAEPVPMLRPADKVQLGEEGTILGRAPSDVWQVRFETGAYLLDRKYIERVTAEESD
jgi:hypothetical protein